MTTLGILLLVLGVLGLFFQGITFWTKKKVIDAGPVQVDSTSPTTVWVPPAVSLGLIVAGIVLLVLF